MRKTPKKKKQKIVYVDDGHTVYDMSGLDEMRGGSRKDGLDLTRRERRAMIRAALGFWIPRLLLVLGCFTLVAVAMYFWLVR